MPDRGGRLRLAEETSDELRVLCDVATEHLQREMAIERGVTPLVGRAVSTMRFDRGSCALHPDRARHASILERSCGVYRCVRRGWTAPVRPEPVAVVALRTTSAILPKIRAIAAKTHYAE